MTHSDLDLGKVVGVLLAREDDPDVSGTARLILDQLDIEQRERDAAVHALRQVGDDLESLTVGASEEGVRTWSVGDQNIYALAIEEASGRIHERADDLEGES